MEEENERRLTTIPLRFQQGEIMAEVSGRLITDLHPNRTVRMVFLQHVGGGYERPLIANNLDVAEQEFINTLGLTPRKAAE